MSLFGVSAASGAEPPQRDDVAAFMGGAAADSGWEGRVATGAWAFRWLCGVGAGGEFDAGLSDGGEMGDRASAVGTVVSGEAPA